MQLQSHVSNTRSSPSAAWRVSSSWLLHPHPAKVQTQGVEKLIQKRHLLHKHHLLPQKLGELALNSHPESFLRKKCLQMLVQGSPTQSGVLFLEGISACSPKTFPPLGVWELLAFYGSTSQASAWSVSIIHKANSWATKRIHIFSISELDHLPFTPCGIQILSKLGHTQRADDCSINLENSFFSKQKPRDVSINFINSPPLSVKVVKLLQIVSWVPSNTKWEGPTQGF